MDSLKSTIDHYSLAVSDLVDIAFKANPGFLEACTDAIGDKKSPFLNVCRVCGHSWRNSSGRRNSPTCSVRPPGSVGTVLGRSLQL